MFSSATLWGKLLQFSLRLIVFVAKSIEKRRRGEPHSKKIIKSGQLF